MIFFILICVSVLAAIFAAVQEPNAFISIIVFIAVLDLCLIISGIFTYLLSMWLGKSDKYVLRETRLYPVELKDAFTLRRLDTGAESNIPEGLEIIFSNKYTTPTLAVKHYGLGGWRKKLLVEVYPDTYKIILHLPKDEE